LEFYERFYRPETISSAIREATTQTIESRQ